MSVESVQRPAFGRADPSFAEFVAMMAATMALQALAIDAMLPALPQIGATFSVTNANQLQWVVMVFMLGTGAGQLMFGPLSDRFGRRPVLLSSVVMYTLASIGATFAHSLPALLITRAVQGFVVAAASVVARSIVRDRFSGSTMARVMSTIFIVFLLVPMLAPAVGQLLLTVVNWRGIFGFLALCGLSVSGWLLWRLPETLAPDHRRPLSSAHMAQAAWFVITEPSSILYTLAMTVMFGSLLAYVSTVPQIFDGAFHQPHLMAITFAVVAGAMGVASYFNTRIVERIGMHRVSHLALLAFVAVTGVHALTAWLTNEGVVTFALFQAATMACMGLSVSNFGTIAMQPMARMAGSAASIQGVISTMGGASVGSLIGQQWAGSVAFLPTGAFCCGLFAFGCIALAERSRMFQRRAA
jgi:MFS transporter, DHA1 family, multidrug resistance protein